MKTYTITEEDIKNFHNARCDLFALQSTLTDLFKEDSTAIKQINRALSLFDASFSRLRDESDANLESKMDFFQKIQEEKKFCSIFSMFNVESIFDIAKAPSDKGMETFPTKFTMSSYYTNKTVEYDSTVPPTYLDLWSLADVLVRDADDSHVFIEGFRLHDNEVHLSLGS